MDLVSEFIARYRKEYDFYEQACRIVAQILDSNLQSAGIRAIVTSRAKNPARLEVKVRQRALKTQYETTEDIYNDIVDLAGVRVALYFPGEREEVGKIVRTLFSLVDEPKEFPTSAQPSYKKRFSGYWATHYRVYIPDTSLNESQKRYAEARIEIQVASVLMHAWSEVEHDLVYKPLQGQLSEDEYAILDELNGLVLSGEIALERLQRAGELRASSHGREYANHYDLAGSLVELVRENLSTTNLNDASIGRVDWLYQLLESTKLNTPDRLAKYVKFLHNDFEKRPIAEQIIDQILAEDTSRYATFERIRLLDTSFSSPFIVEHRRSHSNVFGEFMGLWILFERRIRSLAEKLGYSEMVPPTRLLLKLPGFSKDVVGRIDRVRRFRNQVVHGIGEPDMETIQAYIQELRSILDALPGPALPDGVDQT